MLFRIVAILAIATGIITANTTARAARTLCEFELEKIVFEGLQSNPSCADCTSQLVAKLALTDAPDVVVLASWIRPSSFPEKNLKRLRTAAEQLGVHINSALSEHFTYWPSHWEQPGIVPSFVFEGAPQNLAVFFQVLGMEDIPLAHFEFLYDLPPTGRVTHFSADDPTFLARLNPSNRKEDVTLHRLGHFLTDTVMQVESSRLAANPREVLLQDPNTSLDFERPAIRVNKNGNAFDVAFHEVFLRMAQLETAVKVYKRVAGISEISPQALAMIKIFKTFRVGLDVPHFEYTSLSDLSSKEKEIFGEQRPSILKPFREDYTNSSGDTIGVVLIPVLEGPPSPKSLLPDPVVPAPRDEDTYTDPIQRISFTQFKMQRRSIHLSAKVPAVQLRIRQTPTYIVVSYDWLRDASPQRILSMYRAFAERNAPPPIIELLNDFRSQPSDQLLRRFPHHSLSDLQKIETPHGSVGKATEPVLFTSLKRMRASSKIEYVLLPIWP
jgi:hypothetical protein